MRLAELAAALARLDAFPAPAILRLDASQPLTGRAVVLPAAFNPPTAAHIALLRVAMGATGAGAAVALLSTRNADKPLVGAPLHHRAGMLLALTAGQPNLAAAATNAALLAEQGTALRRAYPDAAVDFVVGYDTLVRIFEPRYYERTDMTAVLDEFFAAHRLLAAERGPGTREAIEEILAGPGRRWRHRVLVLELPAWVSAVSSTEVRIRRARGFPTAGVPPAVARYILRHRLYRDAFK